MGTQLKRVSVEITRFHNKNKRLQLRQITLSKKPILLTILLV